MLTHEELPVAENVAIADQLAFYLRYLVSLQPGKAITFTDADAIKAVHGGFLDKNFNEETGVVSLAFVDDPTHNHAND